MYLLYDLILLVATVVLVPWYLLRGIRHGKQRRGIRERLGFYAPARLEPLRDRKVFWIHAVSVGETRAAVPLVKALRRAYPDAALLLSNVTETGHAIASGLKEVDLCLYFPFDLSWVVRRVLRQVRPSLVIIVETEIWPNFVRLSSTAGIPVLLVNGRISDRSFPRYQKARWLLRPVLERFAAFCMQSEADAARIRALGAPAERVAMTRNLKFDMEAAIPDAAEVERLRQEFHLPAGIAVWVAGSTHVGEEEAVADLYRELLEEGRRLVLILVPRHPERCRGVGEMLAGRGFTYTIRSALPQSPESLAAGDVLLVDTIGEMLKFYACADVVFVGGSLVPIGGHNVLEASLLKKPVVFGSCMQNFREIATLLLQRNGGVQAVGVAELCTALRRLLDNPDEAIAMGERGHALLRENAGATDATLAIVRRVLGR